MPACRDSSPCFCQTQLVSQPEAQRGAETGLTLRSVIHEEVGVRPQLEVEEQEIPCVGGVEMHVARVGLGSGASLKFLHDLFGNWKGFENAFEKDIFLE